MTEHNELCMSCKYRKWLGDQDLTGIGECRRNASQPILVESEEHICGCQKKSAEWPEVSGDEWCGEYKATKARKNRLYEQH